MTDTKQGKGNNTNKTQPESKRTGKGKAKENPNQQRIVHEHGEGKADEKPNMNNDERMMMNQPKTQWETRWRDDV